MDSSCYESIRDAVMAAVDERSIYISRHDLEPAVWLPASNWAPVAPNCYLDGFRALAASRAAVERLRELSQPFSGYDLSRLDSDPSRQHWIALWHTLTAGLARRFCVQPPAICGERGDLLDGIIVNHDTMTYQERMTLLAKCGVMNRLVAMKAPRILEIGGGYGALALAITRACPRARYVICDLPESLMYSGLYLAEAGCAVRMRRDATGITLLPNYRFRELTGLFDVAINTLSMSEMSEAQVRAYCEGIRRLLHRDGVFFEQNQDNRHVGLLNAEDIIANYFSAREDITHHVAPPMNGRANLWHLHQPYNPRPASSRQENPRLLKVRR